MERVDWMRFGLPSPVETGKDGFPHPGKATRCYREQKKRTDATWTQKCLAQELGLTERAVCYLESHDVGLDSISLRRRLALLFTIPPILFGLASLEDEVDPGQTVKQYRKMMPKKHPLRSQKGLARALSITDKAVRDMEKKNIGLDSITRRRVLALLLDIPPATLGIITLEEILLLKQKATTTILLAGAKREKEATFDLAFYKDRLKTFWNRNHANTAQDRMTQLAADIADLTTALPYTSGDNEKEVRTILCRYLQLYAHILRDQGRYDAAIAELEKAAILAERAENLPLLAVTLLRIGSVLRDRGDVIEAQAKIETARGNSTGANQKRRQANADYMAAIDCYTRIRNLASIPKALHGVMLFDEGYAQAHLAYDNQDARRSALAHLKNGGKIIAETSGILEDEFSIRITERTYRNTKAAALLAAGWPNEALQELTDLMDLPPEGDMTRQNAYTDYLWSQAYADLRLIDAAATPAQEAFVIMKQIKSHIHMMRIAGLQGQLSQLDSKHIEVIRLGVMVNL
ncbi:MAG: tetratricopeptide repeat protein [Ktedonobacteraceae bacterium]|nr:tetratricopeptide repeat protein [Ktedonobacteraceae bacterium]